MNLVETTWLTRYPRPTDITYNQESEFISHEFIKYTIETEYGITSNPRTSVNPNYSAISERIHQVIGNQVRTYNIKETYVEKDDSWSGFLSVAAFAIFST